MPAMASLISAAVTRMRSRSHLDDESENPSREEVFHGPRSAAQVPRPQEAPPTLRSRTRSRSDPDASYPLASAHLPRHTKDSTQGDGLSRRDFSKMLEGQLKASQEALIAQHDLAVELARRQWEEFLRTRGKLVESEKEKKALQEEVQAFRQEAEKRPPSRQESRTSTGASVEAILGTEGPAWCLKLQEVAESEELIPGPAETQVFPSGLNAPDADGEESANSKAGESPHHRFSDISAWDHGGTSANDSEPKPQRKAGRSYTQLFKIHDSWRDDLEDKEEQLRKGALTASIRKAAGGSVVKPVPSLPSVISARERAEAQSVSCQDGVLGPNAPLRVVWDFLSLMFVIYDVFVIPLQLLDLPKSDLLTGLAMCTRLFWTADIPLSFNTGFLRSNGSVEMGRKVIAIAYIRTWFLLDIVILGIDWFDLASDTEAGGGWTGLGKASRTFRLVRMIRLLRVVRINKRLAGLMEYANSEKLVIVVDIAKNMFVILGTSHFTACIWASLDQGAKSWREQYIDNRGYLPGTEFWPLYLMSFHWSLSQFAGGMDEVTPGTELERFFAVCMLLLAFIAASIFVSSITSSMTQLTIINSQESQQLSLLKRYLKQTGITKGLSTRIMTNAQHMLIEVQRHRDESKVDILRLISEPLRVELHFEIYTPHLSSHPFFRSYIEDSPNVVRRVCHCAMRMLMVSHSDTIFVAGEVPSNPAMYIVVRGGMIYKPLQGADARVEVADWISEPTLWLASWRHMGELRASTDSCLCILDASQFRSIAANFEHLSEMDPRSYAAAFTEAVNNMSPERLSDLKFDSPELYDPFNMAFRSRRGSMRATILRMVSPWEASPAPRQNKPGLQRAGTTGRFGF